MTDIILRIFGAKVYAVNPENISENINEPYTDLILTFNNAGIFITAQLMKQNEEQSSDDS